MMANKKEYVFHIPGSTTVQVLILWVSSDLWIASIDLIGLVASVTLVFCGSHHCPTSLVGMPGVALSPTANAAETITAGTTPSAAPMAAGVTRTMNVFGMG